MHVLVYMGRMNIIYPLYKFAYYFWYGGPTVFFGQVNIEGQLK